MIRLVVQALEFEVVHVQRLLDHRHLLTGHARIRRIIDVCVSRLEQSLAIRGTRIGQQVLVASGRPRHLLFLPNFVTHVIGIDQLLLGFRGPDLQVARHADLGVDATEVRLLLAYLAFEVDVAL